jgi:vitamin B12 transporter
MNTHTPAHFPRRITIPLAAALTVLPALAVRLAAQATPEPIPLDQVVVTATRTPVPLTALGSSVDFISGEDLDRRQVTTMREALGGMAGMPASASGAMGATTSLFLRGANSNQTLFLVDGMRLNDPNTDYAVFLGGAGLSAADSIEIARGPQSTLYGGEAVGGVVSLRTLKGEGAPSARIGIEGGSFGTIQGSVGAEGARDGWAYNAWLQSGRTENQRPNNDFAGTTYAVRLDRQVAGPLAVGATLRGFIGAYGSPGDRFTNDPDNREREQNQLATLFAEYAVSPAWSGRLTLGGQDRRFVSENPTPGLPTQTTVVTNRRSELDWQNTIALGAEHRLTAGLTVERDQTRNNGFGDINRQESLLAFFAQDEWTPVENVFLTGGLRSDDHDTVGRTTTGRVTAAWLPMPGRVKLRGSFGTGFRSPSFLDLYGQSSYYQGNPRLQPEHARGWDAGVDFFLPAHRGTLSATWFDTRFHDLIVYDFSVFPGTTANVDQARTRGLELSEQARLGGSWEMRAAYTYLEADNLTEHTRLLRRPRQMLSVDVWRNLGGGVSVGAGVLSVAKRQDINAQTFATVDAPDYTVARLYAAWSVSDRVKLKVRFENVLDKHYEEVNGYPALGAGAFAGVEARF